MRRLASVLSTGVFNLDKAFFVKHFTDCGDDFTTLDKYLLDFRICDEVNVALTEAQFGIAKSRGTFREEEAMILKAKSRS